MATATATRKASKNGAAKAKEETRYIEPDKSIFIQPLNTAMIRFKLEGASPLVLHAFGAKARMQMLEQQMGKKKSPVREARCPEEEYLNAFYWIDPTEPPEPDKVENDIKYYDKKRIDKILENATLGMPVTGIKNAMISAARNTSLKMTALRQQLFVTSPDHHDMVIINGKPQMDNRIVRVGKKQPMERFRPMFVEWSTEVNVEWDANVLNADIIGNLLAIAGHYVGLCEGRPEKSALSWGRFKVVAAG